MTATSGRSCFGSWKSYARPGWLARMFLDFFLSMEVWRSNVCWLRWKHETTKSSGYSIIRLRASARRTYETESSSSHVMPLPTQSATPYGSSGNGSGNNTNSRGRPSLEGYARMWPTASARDWKDTPGMAQTGTNPDGSSRQRVDQLARAVYAKEQQMWPTPKSSPSGSDYARMNRPKSGGDELRGR